MPPLTNDQASIATIQEHLRTQDVTLGRIEARVIETNGRVTTLERDRAVKEALAAREAENRRQQDVHDRDEAAKKLRAKDRLWWVVGGLVTAGSGSAVGTMIYVVFLHHPLK